MIAPLVVANWKMHGTQAQCVALARQIAQGLRKNPGRVEVIVAPPYTALAPVIRAMREGKVGVAAQNCHWQESGAFTGEVSPMMLRDAGCTMVILGHSERRHIFNESDGVVGQKVDAALRDGLRVILCVGESLDERRKGQTAKIITRQLKVALKGLTKNAIENLEIAYEPVWAIGTGHNATSEQITQVHKLIRKVLSTLFSKAKASRVRILYGGSVKPDNALALAQTSGVDGLLVGGASLKAESFLPIVRSFSGK